jgi:hypothetical protein
LEASLPGLPTPSGGAIASSSFAVAAFNRNLLPYGQVASKLHTQIPFESEGHFCVMKKACYHYLPSAAHDIVHSVSLSGSFSTKPCIAHMSEYTCARIKGSAENRELLQKNSGYLQALHCRVQLFLSVDDGNDTSPDLWAFLRDIGFVCWRGRVKLAQGTCEIKDQAHLRQTGHACTKGNNHMLPQSRRLLFKLAFMCYSN